MLFGMDSAKDKGRKLFPIHKVEAASTLGDKFLGSGSLEQDGSLSIVAMEEEEQACLMHQHRLGKREHHADNTSQTLA